MGYTISYDDFGGKYEIRKSYPFRFPLLLTAAFCLFLFLTVHFWPEGAAVVQSALIPGDDAITVQAFDIMTQELKAGAPWSAAFETFCRNVIYP